MEELERKFLILFGIVFLAFVLLIIPFEEVEGRISYEDQNRTFLQSSEYLVIDCNEDWESQGFPGNGTIDWPYLVENISFSHILIMNSNVYFLIQNCQIENDCELTHVVNGVIRNCHSDKMVLLNHCDNIAISNLTSFVMYLEECNNVKVSDQLYRTTSNYDLTVVQVSSCANITMNRFDIEGAPWGIFITESYNCTIANSIFTDCGYWPPGGSPNQGGGIYFNSCMNCTIQKNTFIDNYGTSFILYGSDFCEISENYVDIKSGSPGIRQMYEDYSISCKIFNNTFDRGLHLSGGIHFNISWNKLGAWGLDIYGFISESLIHTISDNTVLGKPLLYIMNEINANYTEEVFGQVIVVNSTGINIAKSELLISGPGIRVIQSRFCTLSEIVCDYIGIEESNWIRVEKSDLSGPIYVRASSESIIDNNSITDAGYGILVTSGSSKSNITNNNIHNIMTYGIQISGTECRVENNTVKESSGSFNACYESTTTTIREYGAIEIFADNCLVLNNSLIANLGYGIYVTGSSNVIYGNTMIRNSLANGYSNGEDNQWDDGVSRGNFWDDWLGFGFYYVSGPEGCLDRYPNGTDNSVRGLEILVLIGSVSSGIIVVALILKTKFKLRKYNHVTIIQNY